MRINQNITAFNAYRNLNQTQNQLSSSLEKLSSGFRINRAADDASGLVNSENLRSQIGGLKVATRNAQDAISLVQTAEGAQTEVHSILQRMRDLVVQSGNLGTNDDAALEANQGEIAELREELTRIADQTQFGTKKILEGERTVGEVAGAALGGAGSNDLGTAVFGTQADLLSGVNTAFGVTGTTVDDLKNIEVVQAGGSKTTLHEAFHNADGTFNGAATLGVGDRVSVVTSGDTDFTFQVGANATQQVTVSIDGVSATGLGLNGIDMNPLAGLEKTDVDSALNQIDTAIGNVSSNRATLGAFQNRMESTIRNVSVAVENLSAAESRIRDTDMASEMVEFTRNQILSQAGTSMLAQANMVPQSVLSLLG